MKIVQKVDLPLEITFCSIFFKKHEVVPFGFFQILIKIQIEPFSGLTFLCFLGKKRYIFEFALLHLNLLKANFFYKRLYQRRSMIFF